MWINRKRFDELLKKFYERGYNHGFQVGQLHTMKEILRWRRILDGEPAGMLEAQIEEILRKKVFGSE